MRALGILFTNKLYTFFIAEHCSLFVVFFLNSGVEFRLIGWSSYQNENLKSSRLLREIIKNLKVTPFNSNHTRTKWEKETQKMRTKLQNHNIKWAGPSKPNSKRSTGEKVRLRNSRQFFVFSHSVMKWYNGMVQSCWSATTGSNLWNIIMNFRCYVLCVMRNFYWETEKKTLTLNLSFASITCWWPKNVQQN